MMQEPNGSVRWAAVKPSRSNGWPLVVRRPEAYQVAKARRPVHRPGGAECTIAWPVTDVMPAISDAAAVVRARARRPSLNRSMQLKVRACGSDLGRSHHCQARSL